MLFYQPREGYCFNSDSIFLYDFATQSKPKGRLLDVGAGVGVIGLLLTRDFGLSLTMVEKQPSMAAYARLNAKINRIEAVVEVDDFLTFSDTKQYDMIVSNPPFYHSDVLQSDDEHISMCRYNVHLPIDSFIRKVKRLLSPRGRFVFCYDASQLMALMGALDEVGLRVERVRFVHPKRERAAKLVMIEARNQSRSRSRIEPPLFVHGTNGFTQEAEAIFKKARTHTIKCEIS